MNSYFVNVVFLPYKDFVYFYLFQKIKNHQNNFSFSPDRAGILAAKRRDIAESGNCNSKHKRTIRSK